MGHEVDIRVVKASSSALTRDADALRLATTTSAKCAWALHRQSAQPCPARPQSIGKTARACSLIDSMAHARIKQQEHGHVHMHTCVALPQA